jgi:hypothetical protein
LTALGALEPSARAAPDSARSEITEYQMKASQLGHFLCYTHWPEGTFKSENDPVRVLVVGEDPFGRVLDDALTKKRIGPRAIIIERVAKVPEVVSAHAVFCGGMAPEQRLALIQRAADRPVLLVGETRASRPTERASTSSSKARRCASRSTPMRPSARGSPSARRC